MPCRLNNNKFYQIEMNNTELINKIEVVKIFNNGSYRISGIVQ